MNVEEKEFEGRMDQENFFKHVFTSLYSVGIK